MSSRSSRTAPVQAKSPDSALPRGRLPNPALGEPPTRSSPPAPSMPCNTRSRTTGSAAAVSRAPYAYSSSARKSSSDNAPRQPASSLAVGSSTSCCQPGPSMRCSSRMSVDFNQNRTRRSSARGSSRPTRKGGPRRSSRGTSWPPSSPATDPRHRAGPVLPSETTHGLS
jgi:hypothetical protein